MANEKSILDALYALEKAVIEANCLGETLTLTDASPPWAHLFAYQSERIHHCFDALDSLIRIELMPLLRQEVPHV
jgi:hypothetical protein